MNADRGRAALMTAALLVVTFGAGAIGGYVYSHEPQRAALLIQVEAPSGAPDGALRGGVAVDAVTVQVEAAPFALPAGLPLDDLVRVDTLPDGTVVNVGVDRTEFGQVLTGVVAVEETP